MTWGSETDVPIGDIQQEGGAIIQDVGYALNQRYLYDTVSPVGKILGPGQGVKSGVASFTIILSDSLENLCLIYNFICFRALFKSGVIIPNLRAA